jgi:hypothetical protein
MTLHLIPSEFPDIRGKFRFLFYQCMFTSQPPSNHKKIYNCKKLFAIFWKSGPCDDALTREEAGLEDEGKGSLQLLAGLLHYLPEGQLLADNLSISWFVNKNLLK